MANRFAIANGNWSNPAIWDNGALPQQEDNVYANGYTITIDQDVTVTGMFSNASPIYLPNSATPAMTSNSAPSGVAISSSGTPYYAFAQDGYSGFTGGAGSYWQCAVINTGWLGYQFPTPKTIVKYAFYPWTDTLRSPSNWTFEASNDGITWTVLDTRSGVNTSSTWNAFSFSNTTAYYYYRINITACLVSGYSPIIYEFMMTESSLSATGITNGGTFQLSGGRTLNVLSTIGGGGNHCVDYIGTAGQTSYINTKTINGNYGSSTVLFCIRHSGAGTLYITATDAIGNPFSDGSIQVNNSAAVCNITVTNIGSPILSYGANLSLASFNTVNIIGNLYGNNASAYGMGAVYVSGNGTVNITGNLYGGSNWPTYAGRYPALTITANATVNITGNLISSNNLNGGGPALDITSICTVTITGNVTAGATYYPAIYCTASTASVYVYGQLIAGGHSALFNMGLSYITGPLINSGFMQAFAGYKVYLIDVPIRWKMYATDGISDNSMYSSDYAPEYPDVKDVRYGISYNGGLMTGTVKIPNEQYVQKGFVYDGSRTGTGMLSASDIAAGVWAYGLSNITNTNSIGYRLKNVTTVESLGKQLAGFNGL